MSLRSNYPNLYSFDQIAPSYFAVTQNCLKYVIVPNRIQTLMGGTLIQGYVATPSTADYE